MKIGNTLTASGMSIPLKNISEAFLKTLKAYPNKIAVQSDGDALTYTDLNAQANQLANYLMTHGTVPGRSIALALPPSPYRIVVLLAILKLGCIYVPLDSQLPEARLYYQLIDSEACILITDSHFLTKFTQSNTNFKIINIDSEWSDIAKHRATNISVKRDMDDLACILYTSGTTGKPKGVCIPHRAILRLAIDQNFIRITSKDVIAEVANIAFDASLFEIWSSLLNGARLVIFKNDSYTNPHGFASLIKSSGVTIMFLTTQLFNTLCLTKVDIFSSIKYLLIGGEQANAKIISDLLKTKRRPKFLLNMYGPTENTTFSTWYLIKTVSGSSIPIGKAIANTNCYVLNDKLQLVKKGGTGELYLSGKGLAEGYLNDGKLTNLCFIQNPFTKYKNDKLYKTGDLVKYGKDGTLDLIKRLDTQIKLRGYRIELADIENQLHKHAEIAQATVILHEDKKKHAKLIAYLVLKSQQTNLTTDEIIKYLKNKLPPYMIPTDYVILNEMPLTPNAKIDKKNLPLPSAANKLKNSHVFLDATTRLEKKLSKIWCKILNLKKIGVNDSFIALGGHSLLITQVILAIQKAFNVNITLEQFYQHITIHRLAGYLQHKSNFTHTTRTLMQRDSSLKNFNITLRTITYASHPVKNILLTGANGFVGAHLLSELLHKTTATIYCLIRGKNMEEIKQKLDQSFVQYQLTGLSKRVIPILGDLERPRLGLSKSEFKHLSQNIDVIYHNAAFVHHIFPYEVLRKANIVGTIDLIKLALEHKIKPIHYISTLGAASKIDNKGLLAEDYPDENPVDNNIGYYQTKWVAERLLTELKNHGHPVSIYRLGRISGQIKTGISNYTNDHFQLFIKGCIAMKAAPQVDKKLDMAPVDIVAKMVIGFSLNCASANKVFNIYNPNFMSWNDYIDFLNGVGFDIKFVTYVDWLKKLKEVKPNHILYPLIPFYLAHNENWLLLENGNLPKPDHAVTDHFAAKFKLTFPHLNHHLLLIYLNYLILQKFI